MKAPVVLGGALVVVVLVAGLVLFQRRNAALETALQAQRAADSARAARQRQQAESVAAEAAKPQDLALVDVSALDVSAGGYYDASFTTKSGTCSLQGHVQALAGGSNKDVRIFVQTDDDFTNWKSRARGGSPEPAIGLYVSPQQTATTLNVALPGPGKYHVVVSNVFSVTATKTVQAQVHVICTP
jgi:hypothetical protein